MKICAILPAFNEATNISKLIREIRRFNADVIVVDDGSEDETSLAAETGNAYLIRHNKSQGKGTALKDGFAYAIEKGYELIIVMDADGQHNPSDMPRFINRFKETNAPVIVGNRMASPANMPLIRIFTNRLMSFIISFICRQSIPDTQCGYRLFTRKAICDIEISYPKFEIESEMLIKLARKGYRIESLPIASIYAGEKSQIRPIHDAFRFIGFLANILLKKG